MQTFLPYTDFQKCAAVIDKKRSWKQVVECKQILCALNYSGAPDDWKASLSWIKRPYLNHPAVKMWKGFEDLLALYYNTFLKHAKEVLHINTELKPLQNKPITEYEKLLARKDLSAATAPGKFPFWFFNEDFHQAYRSRLIAKDPGYYRDTFPGDEGFNEGKYLWPDMATQTYYII